MQVKAAKNLIYGGKIYQAGAIFDCDKKIIPSLQERGLISQVEFEIDMTDGSILPSLDEELKRKKR